MAPFTLLDFVGLDITYYITQVMFDEFKERRRFASAAEAAMAGWYVGESGRGFYGNYSDANHPKAGMSCKSSCPMRGGARG